MVSTMQAKMLSRAGQKGAGQCIRASIPYVRADIPILIIFRALGFVVSGALEGQCRAGIGACGWGVWGDGPEACKEILQFVSLPPARPLHLKCRPPCPPGATWQADKDILEHIVYDFNDTEMMEALRPSIEEAFPIQSQVGAARGCACPCRCACLPACSPCLPHIPAASHFILHRACLVTLLPASIATPSLSCWPALPAPPPTHPPTHPPARA